MLYTFFSAIWPQKPLQRDEMPDADEDTEYDTLDVSPVRQDIQDMASVGTDDTGDFSMPESETDRKIREYIAEKMAVALASAKDKKKAAEDIQGFLSGEIAALSGEAFTATVDDSPTYEFPESHKHDLPMMLRCCEAELRNMASTGAAAAPFYFARAAILAKKEKNYELEVKICQLLITAYRIYSAAHRENGVKSPINVRAGTSYENIVKRLPVAKAKLKQLKVEAKQKKLEERR
ncbi:MAG: hypothetical protein FWD79_10120 [Desulfobulbus sp.]|nr:hypothetical protein [Desulfobulbus sp.]